MAGTRAEFEHRLEDARILYQQAWNGRTDDYDACIAAHYVARFQDSAIQTFLNKMVPFEGDYHHREGNSSAHIKTTLLGVSQTVLIDGGRLVLGTWQSIFV